MSEQLRQRLWSLAILVIKSTFQLIPHSVIIGGKSALSSGGGLLGGNGKSLRPIDFTSDKTKPTSTLYTVFQRQSLPLDYSHYRFNLSEFHARGTRLMRISRQYMCEINNRYVKTPKKKLIGIFLLIVEV